MKFKNNSISKNVLKVLIELFPDASNENPVVTHEPNFSSTNANKYVKECKKIGYGYVPIIINNRLNGIIQI